MKINNQNNTNNVNFSGVFKFNNKFLDKCKKEVLQEIATIMSEGESASPIDTDKASFFITTHIKDSETIKKLNSIEAKYKYSDINLINKIHETSISDEEKVVEIEKLFE